MSHRSLVLIGLTTCTLMFPMKRAKAQPGTQVPQTFETTITRTIGYRYLLYLPKEYDAKARQGFPLMIFLHGAGERGTNVQKVAVHGPPKLVAQGTNFPFIVVSPQCPANQRWQDDVVLALLDDLCAKYNVDTNRLYLTGLSMGGYGSWSLAAKYPERFAAIVPICGGGETIDVLLAGKRKESAFKKLAIRAFHGGKDPVVPLSESQRMVDAFKRVGTDVELTIFPDAGHDSWTAAYSDPKLFEWILAHGKK